MTWREGVYALGFGGICELLCLTTRTDQPKISQLCHMAAQENILRLDVPVHEILFDLSAT